MLLNCKRGFKTALYGLILTSFVTACVKNESKDGGIQDEITLSQDTLLKSNSTGQDTKVIQYTSETIHKKIIQEWTFDSTHSSDIIINYVKYNNEQCASNESLIYHFEIQKNQKNSSGAYTDKALPMLTKGHKLTINPGKYILRAIIENHGLCKKINLSFKSNISNSKLLSYNSNINALVTCNTVQYNGNLVVGEFAQILTKPMIVETFSNIHSSHTSILNSHAGILCGRYKSPGIHSCKESIVLNHEKKNALIVSQHQCKNGPHRYTRASQLAIINDNQSISSSFKCSYRGKHRNYNFSNCSIIYNLGESLPITRVNNIPDIGIHIERREVQIDFNFDRNNLDMSKIPGQVHVNLYNVSTQEPVFTKSTQINRAKLLNGDIVLKSLPGEKGIRRKLRGVNMNDIHLVISHKENNYETGIFNLSLKQLCNKYPHLITRLHKMNHSIIHGCSL